VTKEQEYQDSKLFLVFYATTRRLPREVVEWSQSPEGKTALEDWEADYHQWAKWWAEYEEVNDVGSFSDDSGKKISPPGSETSDAHAFCDEWEKDDALAKAEAEAVNAAKTA
jgi:hypothetical protein